ncbi:unnamed protein product [Pleuronectes platessa]|uniref:Uncharacterized protein n=1 Tax=Pleuronectes platessa TaxID=8262 RepID=A0A9N7YUL1_PLEPL|nr:unnamed protein product [Pleuronectes platessa]
MGLDNKRQAPERNEAEISRILTAPSCTFGATDCSIVIGGWSCSTEVPPVDWLDQCVMFNIPNTLKAEELSPLCHCRSEPELIKTSVHCRRLSDYTPPRWAGAGHFHHGRSGAVRSDLF